MGKNVPVYHCTYVWQTVLEAFWSDENVYFIYVKVLEYNGKMSEKQY